MTASDSAINSIEVSVALSIVVLLPADINRMVEINEYENFALMMQHSILAIQHVHSFAVKAESMKKELVKKTQDAAGFISSLKKAEAKIKGLLDKAKAARAAQGKVDERAQAAKAMAKVVKDEAKEAEVKGTKAKAELKEALVTKEAELKVVDEKAYSEGQADVRDAYKKQVNLACNRGYYLRWMATLKELSIPEDSPRRDTNRLNVLFSPSPDQSEDKVEEENDDEAKANEADKEANVVARAKSPTLNDQVLDLIEEDEDEVSKSGHRTRQVSLRTRSLLLREVWTPQFKKLMLRLWSKNLPSCPSRLKQLQLPRQGSLRKELKILVLRNFFLLNSLFLVIVVFAVFVGPKCHFFVNLDKFLL
ncbi:uncharacterized protein LOC114261478 [Camellia sinensis]|uniref:uncharacterized protein LOC114261478 n=1 Tax=Camellia sinensis TaxID=4442 RepID=UPI00103573ED|nr:uncharacterized protein LOC114261478 [Camellia sinensis]